MLDLGAHLRHCADLNPLHYHRQSPILDRANIPGRHVPPSSIDMFTSFEERLKALRRELRSPVLRLFLGQVVVEEVTGIDDDLGISCLLVDAPRWGRAAKERVHEGESSQGEARGDEDKPDDMAGGRR